MSRLLKHGLVEVDGIEAGGGPERKRYAITDAGITDVQRWLATPEKPEPYLQSTLYTEGGSSLLTHRDASRSSTHSAPSTLRMMRILTDRKRKGNLADQLICDHALFQPGGRPAVAGAHRRAPRRLRRGGNPMTPAGSLLTAHDLRKASAPPTPSTAPSSRSTRARSSP